MRIPLLSLVLLALLPSVADARSVSLRAVSSTTGLPVPAVTAVVEGRGYVVTNARGEAVVEGVGDAEALVVHYSLRRYDAGRWGCEGSAPPVSTVSVEPSRDRIDLSVTALEQVTDPGVRADEARLVDLVNEARASIGRAALAGHPRVSAVAAVGATAADIYPSRMQAETHRGTACEGVETRAAEAGVIARGGYVETGEVTTARVTSPESALAQFRASAPHWNELMSSKYAYVGVGRAGDVWTMVPLGAAFDVVGPDLVERRTLPSGWPASPAPGPSLPSSPGGPAEDPPTGPSLSLDALSRARYGSRIRVEGSASAAVLVRVGSTVETATPDEDGRWAVRVRATRSTTVVASSAGETTTRSLHVVPALSVRASRTGVRGTIRPASRVRVVVSGRGRTIRRTLRPKSNAYRLSVRLRRGERVRVSVSGASARSTVR